MEFAVLFYLLFISVSLLLLHSYRESLGKKQLKWISVASFFLLLTPLIIMVTNVRLYASLIVIERVVLLFFIPACYIYIFTRIYRSQAKKTELIPLRRWIAKFTSSVNSHRNGRHENPKYKHDTRHSITLYMSQERVTEIEMKISEHFSRNKPFLQHGYSLRMLSEEINIPLHRLSAFINNFYKMNFNDLINEHRVLTCIEKLLKKEWKFKTLEAIAEETGFNNRNTFTSAFKKVTGVNPSEFLKYIKSGKERKNGTQSHECTNGTATNKVCELINKFEE